MYICRLHIRTTEAELGPVRMKSSIAGDSIGLQLPSGICMHSELEKGTVFVFSPTPLRRRDLGGGIGEGIAGAFS